MLFTCLTSSTAWLHAQATKTLLSLQPLAGTLDELEQDLQQQPGQLSKAAQQRQQRRQFGQAVNSNRAREAIMCVLRYQFGQAMAYGIMHTYKSRQGESSSRGALAGVLQVLLLRAFAGRVWGWHMNMLTWWVCAGAHKRRHVGVCAHKHARLTSSRTVKEGMASLHCW